MILQITPVEAVATSLLLACVFVGVLYAIPNEIRRLPRDALEHVKWRMAGTSLAACLSLMAVAYWCTPGPGPKMFTWIGMPDNGVLAAATLPLLLTASLFLGPLVQAWYEWTLAGVSLIPPQANLLLLRNLLFAPLVEEVVFRGCMCPLLAASGFSTLSIILGAPLLFGVAHAHHLYEMVRGGEAMKRAVMMTCFQLTYTTLFGQFAAFLLLRTGHVVAAVVAHCFCNMMGFPRLDFGRPHHPLHSKRHLIYAAYLLGIVLFVLGFFPMTDPSWYGGSIFWKV